MLLLHTPHLHAQVPRFDDDGDALRIQGLLAAIPDLPGEALLKTGDSLRPDL